MGIGFVYGYGGKLAEYADGKWKGTLDSSESQKGLEAFKNFAAQLSKAPKDATEADPPQFGKLGDGKTAAIFEAGWHIGEIETAHPELKGQIGTYALPGPTAGVSMPTFLGGSNLAIAANAKSPKGAYDFLKLLAGAKAQTELFQQGKVIPNTNALLAQAAADPAIKASADAAKQGWFVPGSPNWSKYEASNGLQDLFVNLLTNKKSPADAGKAASDAITTALNAS
jgi:N,N'-diacetylchitobiose transport system substrate-binding protein